MKTNKKGFTLIELIVVIAIIGVLAAILVPSMLGYVKKSKIQGANSTASTLAKAANSAVTDLDEEDKIPADGSVDNTMCTSEEVSGATVADAIQVFFNDFKKPTGTGATATMSVQFKGGVCVAAAVKSGAYYGTYPAVYTAKNWGTTGYTPTSLSDALNAAVTKAGVTTTPATPATP